MPTIYDLDTPTLLVDLDRLEKNITSMAALVRGGGKALYPHTKTHKTPQIARMQLDAGATGLTVAKLGEAEAFAAAGLDNFFVGHEIVGAQKVARLLALAERVRIRVASDSVEAAEPIGAAAHRRGVRLPMMVEIDTGLGRAGTRSLEETVQVAQFIHEHPGLTLEGVFSHEGHLYRAGSEEGRREGVQKILRQVRELKAAFAAAGLPMNQVSLGSTPGAPLFAPEPDITELRPGTYVYLDRSQVNMGAPKAQCALTVLATVVSVRPDGRVVLDSGSKTMAGDLPFPDKTWGEIVDHPELSFVGASEEHGHLQAIEPSRVRVGDKVRIIPNHACTCANMHDTVTTHRGERIEEVWAIAGRGKVQ